MSRCRMDPRICTLPVWRLGILRLGLPSPNFSTPQTCNGFKGAKVIGRLESVSCCLAKRPVGGLLPAPLLGKYGKGAVHGPAVGVRQASYLVGWLRTLRRPDVGRATNDELRELADGAPHLHVALSTLLGRRALSPELAHQHRPVKSERRPLGQQLLGVLV